MRLSVLLGVILVLFGIVAVVCGCQKSTADTAVPATRGAEAAAPPAEQHTDVVSAGQKERVADDSALVAEPKAKDQGQSADSDATVKSPAVAARPKPSASSKRQPPPQRASSKPSSTPPADSGGAAKASTEKPVEGNPLLSKTEANAGEAKPRTPAKTLTKIGGLKSSSGKGEVVCEGGVCRIKE